jgi:hypothetical protein
MDGMHVGDFNGWNPSATPTAWQPDGQWMVSLELTHGIHEYLFLVAEAIDRSTRFRDSHPELAHRFIDVRYTDLVADPLAAVRQIYDQLELRLSDAAAERMRRLAAHRSRYPKRIGSPTLALLKLDVLAEARRFERYCFRFGLGEGESALA